MPEYSIEVKKLVKRYKKAKKNSVNNISFNVPKGQFFAFLGPNGAGKTTTISILTTTLNLTSGEVKILGHDLSKRPDLIRKEIGIIFQNTSLDMNLTAEQNIRVHAGLYSVYPFRPFYALMPKKYKQSVEELAALVDLKQELHSKVGTFSGGMKRKLEIIRSLIHKPKILFLDEPTTGLDPVSRKNVWDYLNHVRKTQDITIFLTTHYLDEAEEADNIVILKNGEIAMNGSPGKIKAELTNDFLHLNSEDQQKLEAELKSKKIPYLKKTNFIIDLDQELTAQKVIKSLETELSYLKIIQPTLEEAYIKLIENNEVKSA